MEPNRPISKHILRVTGLLKLLRRACERVQNFAIKRRRLFLWQMLNEWDSHV